MASNRASKLTLRERTIFIDDERTYSSNRKHYVIELLKKESIEENVSFILKEMLQNHPIIHGLGLHEDQSSIDCLQELITSCLNQEVALGCFYIPEGKKTPVLVGADVLYFPNQNSEQHTSSETYSKYINYLDDVLDYELEKRWDLLFEKGKHYTELLTSLGIVISPEHDHIILRNNLIDKRRDVARQFGVDSIVCDFVTKNMQDVATANKYRIIKYCQRKLTLNNAIEKNYLIKIMAATITITNKPADFDNDDESD